MQIIILLKKKSLSKEVTISKRKSAKHLSRNVDNKSKKFSDKNLLMSNKLISSYKNISLTNNENKTKVDYNSNSESLEVIEEEKLDNF